MAIPHTTVAKPDLPLPSDLPTFTVAERLAAHGGLMDLRESEVSALLRPGLFDEPMTTTWINTEEAGRLHHVVNTLGWAPVRSAWLDGGTMSGAWSTSPEGYLTRGEKGQDVACLMPTRFFAARMRALAEARSERARDVSHLKKHVAEDAAAGGDPQGAERMARMHVTAFKETKGA